MASLNKVFLVGNLTRDPELRYTPQGSAVCEFGLAVNRIFTASDGTQKKDVCFIDVNVWGQQAENCNRYLQKGAQALVEGRLQMDSWEDKGSGAKRSKIRVVAERIQFLSPRGGNSSGESDESSQTGESASQPPQQKRNEPASQRRNPEASPKASDAEAPPPMPKPEEIFEPDANQEDNIPF